MEKEKKWRINTPIGMSIYQHNVITIMLILPIKCHPIPTGWSQIIFGYLSEKLIASKRHAGNIVNVDIDDIYVSNYMNAYPPFWNPDLPTQNQETSWTFIPATKAGMLFFYTAGLCRIGKSGYYRAKSSIIGRQLHRGTARCVPMLKTQNTAFL
jgi:hypothetical protein